MQDPPKRDKPATQILVTPKCRSTATLTQAFSSHMPGFPVCVKIERPPILASSEDATIKQLATAVNLVAQKKSWGCTGTPVHLQYSCVRRSWSGRPKTCSRLWTTLKASWWYELRF